MQAIDILVVALATWRISSYISSEDGWNGWLNLIRVKLGMRYNEVGEQYETNELSRTVICMWCVSLPIAILTTALYLVLGKIGVYILMPFAFSAIAILIHSKYARFKKSTFGG